MRQAGFIRYFLGIRPNLALRDWLAALAVAAGQGPRRIRTEYLHLTLCIVAEVPAPDRSVVERVHAALAGRDLTAPAVGLGRLRGGESGAALHSIGRRGDVLALYRRVVALLAARGLPPLRRASGLHPHVTLGHDPLAIDPRDLAVELIPDAILLIESHVGRTVHRVVGRWPLSAPAQGRFDFAAPPLPPLPPTPSGRAAAA